MNKREVLDASKNNRAVESSTNTFNVKYFEHFASNLSEEELKRMVALDIIIYSNFKPKQNLSDEINKLIKLDHTELDRKRMELTMKNTNYIKQPFELLEYRNYDKKLFISYSKNSSSGVKEDFITIQNPNNRPVLELISELLHETENKITELKDTKNIKPYLIKKTLFQQILDKEGVN